MTRVRWYISAGLLTAFLGAILAILLMLKTDPEAAGFWKFSAVYAAVSVSVFGLTGTLGLALRSWLWPKNSRYEQLRTAVRQAVLFALLTATILLLLAGKVFNIWSAALLLTIFVLIEMYVQ